MRIKSFFFLAIVLFTACSHTNSIQKFASEQDYFDRINRECANENVDIVLCEGDTLNAEFIKIAEDSTTVLFYEEFIKKIPTDSIHTITYNSTSGGTMRGLAVGAGLGLTTALLSSTSNNNEYGAGMLLIFPIEVLISTAVGAIIGDDRTFIVNEEYISN